MTDETVYIVSGFMRSGTSMMMRCLEAGGLEAAFKPARDELNERWGDENYKPNPDGFYEQGRDEYIEPYFPSQYKGRLIKILLGGILPKLSQYSFPVGSYRIVFMRRDPEEIRQSYEAFFEPAPRDAIKWRKWLAEEYENKCWYAINQLNNRIDTELSVLHYREVVEDPLSAFQQLHRDGWPIKCHAAAAIVDKKQCRFRCEELQIGI